MTTLSIRSRATSDIAEIWECIAADSELQADAFVDRLNEEFLLLARRPRLGRSREELGPKPRSFPIGKYVIFYMPYRGGIDVVRVLHSARDVGAQFPN